MILISPLENLHGILNFFHFLAWTQKGSKSVSRLGLLIGHFKADRSETAGMGWLWRWMKMDGRLLAFSNLLMVFMAVLLQQ